MTNQTHNIKGILVKNIKYVPTHRGTAFTADLYMDGKNVGTVENKGVGGCSSIYPDNAELRSEIEKRRKEYFNEENVAVYDDVNSVFVDHLIDLLEFGKVLNDEEVKELLNN